jgi:hypothetical protein
MGGTFTVTGNATTQATAQFVESDPNFGGAVAPGVYQSSSANSCQGVILGLTPNGSSNYPVDYYEAQSAGDCFGQNSETALGSWTLTLSSTAASQFASGGGTTFFGFHGSFTANLVATDLVEAIDGGPTATLTLTF